MKLLIFTQKVDLSDDILGFFHDWILEFSKYYEKVTVICLQKGEKKLPENVRVLSLGKEEFFRFQNHSSRFLKLFLYLLRFYRYIWQERKNYDQVFVHMNSEYVVLGGLFWKLWNKKIALWYMHKSVTLSLRISEKLVDVIFTGSKESFRLKSDKVKITGHGIPIEKFLKVKKEPDNYNNNFKIITIGRISPVKDYETLIKAVKELKKELNDFRVDIIGGPGTPSQKKYFNDLKNIVKKDNLENIINFFGAVPYNKIFKYLKSADLFVHMSKTGSLDKAVLEAMASSLPVLSCNDSSKEILQKDFEYLLYKQGNYKELAKKIKRIINLKEEERQRMGEELRNIVKKNHSLNNLIKKIVEITEKGRR